MAVGNPQVALAGSLHVSTAPLTSKLVFNMTTIFQSTKCFGCGEPLPEGFTEPCPKCGDTRKTHDVSIHESVTATDSMSWQHVHEYYERHPILLLIVFAITIGSPFLGLVLAGWVGVIVGLVIGLFAFVLGLRAVTKVREIRVGN
jgi:hypothetical protein